MKHTGFKELLNISWNRSIPTPAALEGLQVQLKRWNKEVFGNVNQRKDQLLEDIKQIQDALDFRVTAELLCKEEELTKELEVVLEQEEVIWLQKSREQWLAEGDRNTKYFHTSTVIRRRRNRVETLKNMDGVWITDTQDLENMAVEYYRRLYSMEDVDAIVENLPALGFPGLSSDDMVSLNRSFTAVEIERSVRSMGKYKAPGPDGFQPVFYQECWDIVGDSVLRFALAFFSSNTMLTGSNDALVVLLPKVSSPETIMQFRPISLCNVLFKTITKTMVTRLKPIMQKLIGPEQSSFIPGRLSLDNIVVVQEAVHSMRRKKGRKGWMLLKLDLEKAYDRIRWDFLLDTLHAAGFPDKWCNWIMSCVTGPTMTVLWNGEKTTPFKPARGLRQGDPLSPYLFVLCMERLCHLIEKSVAEKEWKPISLSRGGPKLSHMCFADDLILFAEASVAQIRVIRSVLESFCGASGQKVSLDKSKIFFSKNVNREMASLISSESGISSTCDLGKYLGIPVLHKRMNRETFGPILERVESRLAGWRSRFLSLAGRVTLTKSVLASIPVHTMSAIILPSSILDDLDRAARSFLWGKSTHLLAWDRCCVSKELGGLGLKKARIMNKALIAKLSWRLLKGDSGLWAEVLKSKYKVGELQSPSWSMVKSGWSSTWSSIIKGLREVIIPNLRWVIGDGHTARFWSDCWITNTPLCEDGAFVVPVENLTALVSDLWTPNEGWNMSQIIPYVSDEVRLQILSRVVNPGIRDRVSWGGNPNGEFTVSSAYRLLVGNVQPQQQMGSFYARVWTVIAPERARLFLWLTSHQVIMTNMERLRRHLSSTGVCQVCRGGYETILHVLRDCGAMEGIWLRLVPQSKLQAFFEMSLLEWLYVNLGDTSEVNGCPWASLFAIAVWWAWKWRCGNVFNASGKCRNKVMFLQDSTRLCVEAHLKVKTSSPQCVREERMISWLRPSNGWFKVNTDGASHGNPGLATAGGVIRDVTGAWCGGFGLNIGICSAPLAELWGVYYGLCMAWNKGISQLELEVDSEIVVGFFQKRIEDSHPLSFLVHLCYGLLSKDWSVRVKHVYREANRLADGLANYAFSLSLGLHLFPAMPDSVRSILLEDESGSMFPRMVRM